MRKPLSPRGASLLSISPALLSYRSAEGRSQVVAVTWVGIICATPPLLTVALTRFARTRHDIPQDEAFAVNLPAEEKCFSDLLSKSSGGPFGEPDLVEGELPGVPLIAECPVQIECRRYSSHDSYGRELMIRGEVAFVHLEGIPHRVATGADLRRLSPLTHPRRFPLPAWRRWRPTGQL